MRVLFLFLCLLAGGVVSAQWKRFSFSQPKMGSPFQLIFYASDSTTAHQLADQSYRLVDSLNQIFSDYEPHSELNRLCATAGKDSFVAVSGPLWDILLISKKAWKKSDGVFDVTIGPLSRLWRSARRSKRFPDSTEVLQAKSKTGFQKVLIDNKRKRIKLLQAGMQLDLGGIAAGYMAQKVMDFLRSQNIHSALVNASGDIVCSKPPPDKQGWEIAVNLPDDAFDVMEQTLKLQHRSVSTSGDVFQFIEHQGRRYSHIIDMKTGYGVPFQRNVTVVARDGTTADWLATACSILPLHKAKKLVRKYKADLLVTELQKGRIVKHGTKGINRYFDK